MSSTSKNKSADTEWKWSEEYRRYYRQEVRDGKWFSIWDTGSHVATTETVIHPIPRNVNSHVNSSQSRSAAGPSGLSARPQNQRYGSQCYTYGTQNTSLGQISTGLSNLSLVGRDSSGQIGHTTQGRDLVVASSSRQDAAYRQMATPTAAQEAYAYSPPQGSARPVNARTASAPAPLHHDTRYLSQSMPASGSNRSNGQQIAQEYTTGTVYRPPAPNSQTTSRNSANPDYRHAATSTEDDDILSNYAAPILRGTLGHHEALDPSFRKIDSHQEWTFFVKGRVFSTLVWQPAEESHLEGPSMVRYKERAYAKVYRYIVITPKCARHYSKCIRISTHRRQGATKKGLNQSEHCMVYSDDNPPAKLPCETKMNKDPVHMVPTDPTQKLDHTSRVDLARTYPVEHNVKVQNVGKISQLHLKRLVGYVKDLQ